MNDFLNTCLPVKNNMSSCLPVYFSKSTAPKKSGLWKSGLGRSMG